jgi:hypothetical protein
MGVFSAHSRVFPKLHRHIEGCFRHFAGQAAQDLTNPRQLNRSSSQAWAAAALPSTGQMGAA